jgi:AcrR family transcriptional regulator
MKEAGLTVGGFYKHFKSRDALVAEAIGSALEMWKDRIDAAAAGGPRITYEALVDDYVSNSSRLPSARFGVRSYLGRGSLPSRGTWANCFACTIASASRALSS